MNVGQIIRKTAPAQEMLEEVNTTLNNARAKGGTWQQLAEQRLLPVVAHLNDVAARLSAAKGAVGPFRSIVIAKHEEAIGTLGRVSDEIWNAVGRPANDPALSLLFPGGIAHYVRGDANGMPDRLDLLAQLLREGTYRRLPAALAEEGAGEVAKASTALRTAVDAARAPEALVAQVEQVELVASRAAHAQLAALKRLYRAEGFSESEIHAVIANHPPAAPAKAEVPPPPSPAPAPVDPATPGPVLKTA